MDLSVPRESEWQSHNSSKIRLCLHINLSSQSTHIFSLDFSRIAHIYTLRWREDGHCCWCRRRPRASCRASVSPSQRRRCRKAAARSSTEISRRRSSTESAGSPQGEEPHFQSTEIYCHHMALLHSHQIFSSARKQIFLKIFLTSKSQAKKLILVDRLLLSLRLLLSSSLIPEKERFFEKCVQISPDRAALKVFLNRKMAQ